MRHEFRQGRLVVAVLCLVGFSVGQYTGSLLAEEPVAQPAAAAESTVQQEDPARIPRCGCDVNFVVQNPNWRWPSPNGSNPGPGTPVTITYSIAGLTDVGLSCADLRTAVEEALGLWASVAPLNFVELDDSGPCPDPGDTNYNTSRHPQLRFGTHLVDGDRGVLAHAFFPFSSTNGLAGDLHFDCEETWSNGAGSGVIDFLEVCLHEIGHAIGLGHENSNNAIMNPFYGGRFTGLGTGFLLQDDIDGVRAIYGSGTGSVTPLAFGGCGSCTGCPSNCTLGHLVSPSQLQKYYNQYRLLKPLLAGSLGGHGPHKVLDTVRRFRDVALMQSQDGRELAKQYYEQGPAIIRLLAEQPALAAQSLEFVLTSLPTLEATVAADDGRLKLDPQLYERGRGLLRQYQAVAPTELHESLAKLELFLLKRRQLDGTAVTLDLTDPSVLVKPVTRRTASASRLPSSDVGAE